MPSFLEDCTASGAIDLSLSLESGSQRIGKAVCEAVIDCNLRRLESNHTPGLFDRCSVRRRSGTRRYCACAQKNNQQCEHRLESKPSYSLWNSSFRQSSDLLSAFPLWLFDQYSGSFNPLYPVRSPRLRSGSLVGLEPFVSLKKTLRNYFDGS